MLRVIDRLALLGSRDIPGMQSCDYHGHSSDEDRKLCQAEGEEEDRAFCDNCGSEQRGGKMEKSKGRDVAKKEKATNSREEQK